MWFRPRWPAEEVTEPFHLLASRSDDPYEEHAACGESWPRRLNHGSFEIRAALPPSTDGMCPRCVAIYRRNGNL
jgi:hypothetical protein